MKTERFEMRAGEDFLAAVDEWRRKQPDIPPRAEAVRRLVEAGLRNTVPAELIPISVLLRRYYEADPSRVEMMGFDEGTTAEEALTRDLSKKGDFGSLRDDLKRLIRAFEGEEDPAAREIVRLLRAASE